MTIWPKRPILYEINTWVWLKMLSQRENRPVTLGSVPDSDWDEIARLGADAVWLMGVWQRSLAGVRIAFANPGFLREFHSALPDPTPSDVAGSPYSVQNYTVDEHLGGTAGLAQARSQLAQRGMRLILDFVPNHTAPDHPWTQTHPEYFIQGSLDDLQRAPGEFYRVGETVLALGRDPNFEPWADVVQLNAFHPGLRQAAGQTLLSIAAQCDGLRCDMAMLMVTRIFQQTWGERANNAPQGEYWPELIRWVKAQYPHFYFMAEVYWDMEQELLEQGFDACYDKTLYDQLAQFDSNGLQAHLQADPFYQDHLVRFIENHDERRAAVVFPRQARRAAALAALSLPGAKLIHEGQVDGLHERQHVLLERRRSEAPDPDVRSFYQKLLPLLHEPALREGDWRLCEAEPFNAWCWQWGDERVLVVVNLHPESQQARVRLPWDDLTGRQWIFKDAFSGFLCRAEGEELTSTGLTVRLPAWGIRYFRVKYLP